MLLKLSDEGQTSEIATPFKIALLSLNITIYQEVVKWLLVQNKSKNYATVLAWA